MALLAAVAAGPGRLAAQQACIPNHLSDKVLPFTDKNTAQISPGGMHMGRRSPVLYFTTKLGVGSSSIASDPANPSSPRVLELGQQAGGLLGNSSDSCWQGPMAVAVADSPSISGRMVMSYHSCAEPAEVVSISNSGGLSFGQQADPSGQGTAVSPTIIAAAYLANGKEIGYFPDSSAVYAVDVTNVSGNINKPYLTYFQAFSAWASAQAMATGGNASADQYIFALLPDGNVHAGAIGSDGSLSDVASTGGGGVYRLVTWYAGNGVYLIAGSGANGVVLWTFNGSKFSAGGTIPNPSSTSGYGAIALAGGSVPILFAERSDYSVDVFNVKAALPGVSGAIKLGFNIPPVSVTISGTAYTDAGSGLLAWVSNNTGYVYRIAATPPEPSLVADAYDITCVANTSPNPNAVLTVTPSKAAYYVGDTVTFDGSQSYPGSSGNAITTMNWTFTAPGAPGATSSQPTSTFGSQPESVTLFLPCAPATVGNHANSTDCPTNGATAGSVSATLNVTDTGGLKSTAPATASVAYAIPGIYVTFPDGTVVGPSSPTSPINVLVGDTLDAMGSKQPSQGSPQYFKWNAQQQSTTSTYAIQQTDSQIPLNVYWPGGYANSITIPVTVSSVAGSFAVPATVLSSSSTFSVTNNLRIGTGVTINSIAYSIDGGAEVGAPTAFDAKGATTNITAPALGPHTIAFTVNYTDANGAETGTFGPYSFTVSQVTYNPSIEILNGSTVVYPPPFGGGSSGATGYVGVTYSFEDLHDFSTSPSAADTWDFGDGSAKASSSTNLKVTHSYSTTGTYSVELCVTGAGCVTPAVPFTISNQQQASFKVSVTGDTSLSVNQGGNWRASPSGNTGTVTYAWSASDNSTGANSATFSHAFTTAGSQWVKVTAKDGGTGQSATSTYPVNVTTGGGGGGGGNCSPAPCTSLTGDTALQVGQAGHWTAAYNGTSTGTVYYNWFVDGTNQSTTGASLSYTFTSAGSHAIKVQAYTPTGTGMPLTLGSPTSLTVSVTAAAGLQVQISSVSGVTSTGGCGPFNPNCNSQYLGTVGVPVTVYLTVVPPAGATITGYTWNFGDGSAPVSTSSPQVTHTFLADGDFTIGVLGSASYNGNTIYSNAAQVTVNITGTLAQGVLFPGAGSLQKTDGSFATSLYLFNPSGATETITLYYPNALQLSGYDPSSVLTSLFAGSGPGTLSFTLAPDQGWSSADAVQAVCGASSCSNSAGSLLFSVTGGPPPTSASRVYFSPNGGGGTYGTYLPGFAESATGGSGSTDPQYLPGLRVDMLYRSNITLVAGAPGHFDVSLFDAMTGQKLDEMDHIPLGYIFQQAKVAVVTKGTDCGASPCLFFDPTSSGPYFYAVATPDPADTTPSPLYALGTVADNRTTDTMIITANPRSPEKGADGLWHLWIPGVGRISNGAASNFKSDVTVLNTSGQNPRTLTMTYYPMSGSPVTATGTVGVSQQLTAEDIVESVFKLTDGQDLGNLDIAYPDDGDASPIYAVARNYNDQPGGTFGMQLPAMAASDGIAQPTDGTVYLTGLHDETDGQGNLLAQGKIGFMAMGSDAVTVNVTIYDATPGADSNGQAIWTGSYTLNGGGNGPFILQPTGSSQGIPELAGKIFNAAISIGTNAGTTTVVPFGVEIDTQSTDLVFLPGQRGSASP